MSAAVPLSGAEAAPRPETAPARSPDVPRKRTIVKCGHPRPLMLGLGWFPSSLGGLDRYYRSLLEQLPEARGVVLGAADGAPQRVAAVSDESSRLPVRCFEYWRATRRRATGADLIDAHFALYAAAPLLLPGAARALPAVFHFHGPWAEESRAAGASSHVGLALRRRLERAALRQGDAHVVLSSAFRRVLVERYRVPPWDVQVHPPGVDLDRFTPGDRERARVAFGVGRSPFVAVCVRRLVPRMGIEVLLDAWEQLLAHVPGARLLIAGDGPLREQLAERVATSALAGSVSVLGRIDEAQLVELYRCADAAVVPSVCFEGFGLVVLEAAACGTPSVVADVGGLPEAVEALDRSLVVPAANSAALSSRLRAAAGGTLPTREQTRAHAQRFDWSEIAERHRRLYRRVISGERDGRLRVVYLDHVARLSGGEIALLRVLPHLRSTSAHVILGEDGPFAERLTQAGISVEVNEVSPRARELRKDAVGVNRGGLAGVPATLAHVARLALRLRALRPDFVHTNSLKAGVYGALAARAAGVPVVWHARDRIAEDYLPRPAVLLVRRLMHTLADAVIANSQATMQTLGRAPAGQRRVVIADAVLAPSPLPQCESNGAATFGMVGRIAPWKGQDLFLRAFARAFPAGEARAAIVGKPMFGEERYEQELPALAASLGIADRVEFRGFHEDVWAQLAGFDALVHASLTPEPFGQVVLEGMAAGLPVIAADAGGPASLIAHGKTGVLFAPGDERALAAAMRSTHADERGRQRLGQAAREAAVRYHPDRTAAELERLYAQLARARGRR
jgi:glycosyltransferase involved in cell wall biosynthesis